jgi:2-amino-4-hydroxy-6-hydroxymethyldihydropteridine diphosphokinase
MEKERPPVANRLQLRGRIIWIALGSNTQGTWGNSRTTLSRAIAEIAKLGLHLIRRSAIYLTPPMGSERQPAYLNMIIGLRGSAGPFELLRSLKKLEVAAGRRRRGRWKPRPLDLDVLDHGGRVLGSPRGHRVEGRLILPHPEMHNRGFVLVPLAAAAPEWRHPRLGVGARQLLARRPHLRRGIRRLPECAPTGRESAGRRP